MPGHHHTKLAHPGELLNLYGCTALQVVYQHDHHTLDTLAWQGGLWSAQVRQSVSQSVSHWARSKGPALGESAVA